jgi:hypothetical protein
MAIEAGPRSAVQIENSRFVALRRCLVQMRDVASLWQAVYSRGDDVVIEGNVVEIVAAEGGAPKATVPQQIGDALSPNEENTPQEPTRLATVARGGIQVAGGSDRVRIFHNKIRGGVWNGITLGSLESLDGDSGHTPDLPESEDACAHCHPVDITTPPTATPVAVSGRFVSAGDLYDIEIGNNQICDHGINGIGVVRFFDLSDDGDMVGVHRLYITDNLITRCLRLAVADRPKLMERLVGYGGIALAKVADLRILRNQIISNGPSDRIPVCGVFAIIVQGLQLDDNRIVDNGHSSGDPGGPPKPGIRGGVHVWLVLPTVEQVTGGKYTSAFRSDGLPTCAVRDNIVVAPLGRALTFFALGPVAVARNRLVTQGVTGKGLDLLAATVLVGDFGISNEWTMGLLIMLLGTKLGTAELTTGRIDICRVSKLFGTVASNDPFKLWPPLSSYWVTGKLLFTENQVSLDVTDGPFAFALSSTLVLSLDDVGFTDNQLEVSSTNLFVPADAVVLGGSVRIADNRFSETWMRTFFSAITFGGMNTTTDNQSTHCIQAQSLLPGKLIFRDNLALIEVFCPNECE